LSTYKLKQNGGFGNKVIIRGEVFVKKTNPSGPPTGGPSPLPKGRSLLFILYDGESIPPLTRGGVRRTEACLLQRSPYGAGRQGLNNAGIGKSPILQFR